MFRSELGVITSFVEQVNDCRSSISISVNCGLVSYQIPPLKQLFDV